MVFYPAIVVLLIHRAASTLPPASVTLRNIPEDGLIDFMQMSKKYGHPATKHQITTADNYTLTTFNIPGDKSRVVLFNHGVFDTADGWILRGNNSLAIMVAAAGYDVWLLNTRGSRYSRQHTSLNPDTDAQYWDYSVHELGIHDLRANIDYVLESTNQTQLTIIGFSEGTSMSFVLASTSPEYNKKIRACICLAPVAYLSHTIGPLRLLIQFGTFLNSILPSFVAEISGYYSVSKAIVNVICTQLAIGYELCFRGIVSPLIGPNVDAIEQSFFNVMMGHFPAGTSRKNLIHFSQIGLRDVFGAYDYGERGNMERYGAAEPPVYDLRKVSMPVMLVSGENDRVSTIPDVERLHDELPNVIKWMIVEDPDFNHLDHLWANNAHRQEYSHVMETLAKYNPVEGSVEHVNSSLNSVF